MDRPSKRDIPLTGGQTNEVNPGQHVIGNCGPVATVCNGPVDDGKVLRLINPCPRPFQHPKMDRRARPYGPSGPFALIFKAE